MRAETSAKTASTAKRAAIAMLLVAVYLFCAAPVWSAITKVDVANKPDRVLITVSGNNTLKMMPLRPSRGNYVAFQFPCHLAAKGRLVGIRSGGIYNVRISNFRPSPPVSRIVVNTYGRHDYATKWSPDRRRVEITVMKSGISPRKTEVKVKGSTQEISGPGRVTQTAPVVKAEPTIAAQTQPKPIAPMSQIIRPVPAEPKPVLMAKLDDSAKTATPTPVSTPAPAPEFKPADEPAPVAATPKVEVKPVVRVRPIAAGPKMETRAPVRVASTNPTVVAALPAAETKRWSPDRSISLNFLSADINDVLKALAVQSGHNIVSSKDVKGNVTVSLNRVSIDEAMDYVAKLSGYGYARENGTYLVGSKESLGLLTESPDAKPMVQVASIAYANPDDMIQLVKAQFPSLQVSKVSKALPDSESEKSSSDQKMASSAGSKLVFTGDAAAVAAAQAVVTQVDESLKGQLVGQKSEVYRVKYVKPQDLAKTLSALIPGVTVYGAPQDGFDLQGPAAITLSTAGATVGTTQAPKLDLGSDASKDGKDSAAANFDPKSKTRTIIIVGRAEDVEKALALAASIDVKSPQIKIDSKITSITKAGEKQLGLTWEWDDIAFVETGTEAWKRSAFNFGATLDALIKNGNGQLLASPTLVCLEGKPGVFFVGDEVTYIQRIEVTATGQNITTDTKQVGVQLRVNGTANLDGYITLNLHPEVSVIKLETQQGITLPIVTRRFTDHVVRVKDGQTIVIGGLIRSEELEEMKKVPLLGDIPLLGSLFRHRETTKDQTEVVMFITATVLKD